MKNVDDESRMFQKFDKLPRRLDVDWKNNSKGGRYRLVIVDNELDGHQNCCIVSYMKEIKYGYSDKAKLFQVEGHNLLEAIEKMYDKYMELKPKYIKGGFFLFKEYLFDKTHRTEILDGKKYIFRTK